MKRSGRIYKIVRYFNSGPENRYFAKFPEAEGHEVYVLVKIDEQTAEDGSVAKQNNDKFFGCNVGEEVIVSLGETITSRIARYSKAVVAGLTSPVSILSASASLDKTTGPRLPADKTATP